MSTSVPFVQSMHDAAAALQLPGSGLAWLDTARAEALREFAARGLPDTHNELWKYTSLRALSQHGYAVGDADAATREVDAILPQALAVEGPRAVFVNGVFRVDLSDLDVLPQGVTVRSLAAALHEAPEPLRFLLDKPADPDDDGFTLLNRALAADGLVVQVAAGVQVAVPLHVLQFHGDEDEGYCRQFNRPYLKAARVKPGMDLLQYVADFPSAQAILLDAFVDGYGGGGKVFDWTLIPASLVKPIVLSGGLDADNVGEAIVRVRPVAVDVSSGVEAAKGIKDAEKIRAFVAAVRAAQLTPTD